jgi:ectoine hydroxylase-related dioxygenase (phytanoyl-CoA dioxygenase family)
MSRANRYDLLLPLDSVVLPAAVRVMERVGATFNELAGDCHVCELTALVSDCGAAAQPVHHDTSFDETPSRVSLLVALQKVNEDMGPTIFFPRTNTPEWHRKYRMRDDDLEGLLGESVHVRGLLGIGDAVLYDTRLLHCGGANTQQRRALLAISAQLEDSSNRHVHANIRGGYRSRLRVRDAVHWSEMA